MALKMYLFYLAPVAAVISAVLLLPYLDPKERISQWQGRTWADLVVMNATIYTSDPALPFAEALAVRGNRILQVGDFSSIQELVGHKTYKLNLNGSVVVPGFIESHLHLISGGLQMEQVSLSGVKSQGIFAKIIADALKDKAPGEWILGRGWNNELWGGELPCASWIDHITPNNPVWISRLDGHMGLANSLALEIAGINISMRDPVGGAIMRTSEGDPTGLLVDSAIKLILAVIPEASVERRRHALIKASKYALTKGVTTVVDFGRYFPGSSVDDVWHDFSDVYQWADSLQKMMIRVCLFFPMPTWSKLAEFTLERGRKISQWIHLGGVKAFADGSLGSSSALFNEPYEDDPKNHGLQVTDIAWLHNATLESDKSELQVAVHAIGDKANSMVLDMFDSVVSSNGMRDRRFRIEHAQHLAPGSATRFAQQRVIASVQPNQLLDDAVFVEKKIGIFRAQNSYLFRSLISSDAQLVFGSDWPVIDINPLGAINTALHRVPLGWQSAWIPSERIDLNDALKASTISAAYACFLDQDVGSLSAGKYADFVVLPVSSWDQLENDIPTRVSATYVNGKQVYP